MILKKLRGLKEGKKYTNNISNPDEKFSIVRNGEFVSIVTKDGCLNVAIERVEYELELRGMLEDWLAD